MVAGFFCDWSVSGGIRKEDSERHIGLCEGRKKKAFWVHICWQDLLSSCMRAIALKIKLFKESIDFCEYVLIEVVDYQCFERMRKETTIH
ncbi:MAG TPA: hypothetical protein DCM08_00720 [Microscillaceae bacterium]|nr:hypothetical protein [Microscillaceae bacterium]